MLGKYSRGRKEDTLLPGPEVGMVLEGKKCFHESKEQLELLLRVRTLKPDCLSLNPWFCHLLTISHNFSMLSFFISVDNNNSTYLIGSNSIK